MSNQTQVSLRMTNATPGLIADINNYKAVSRALESATAHFGVVVTKGSTATQALVGGSEAGILGLTIRSVGMEAANVGATELTYSEGEAIAVMTEGYMFASCEGGALEGSNVIFDNVTGVLSSGTPAVGQTEIVDAKWDADVAAGAVGRVYIGSVVNLVAGA